ncbi:MAG: xanthine dehydrogenase accessory protein XdhC [Proteobacteria bacterium]|nr:xanthine dehydrogenase accessory protein XdhC [Pseudomonadota bacterium]
MTEHPPVPSDDWLAALQRHRDAGEPCALVTIVAAEGSSPRDGGTKMVVGAASRTGSVGGGHLELKAIEIARAMLAKGETAPKLERFALGPALGQCCGGAVSLLIEPFAAVAWNVWIFGAGHVGRALVHHLAGLPAKVSLVDAREAEFPPALPANAAKIVEPCPEDAVRDVPPGAMVLVMTHSHDLDLLLVERLLRRGDLAYVGLIGSASKRARFEARLAAKKVPTGALVCPVGIGSFRDKHPHAIAIAIAAQLLERRSQIAATTMISTQYCGPASLASTVARAGV